MEKAKAQAAEKAKAGLGSMKDGLLKQAGLQTAPKHPLAVVMPKMPKGLTWLEVDTPDGQTLRLPIPEDAVPGQQIILEYTPLAPAAVGAGFDTSSSQPPVVAARPIPRPPNGIVEHAVVAYFKSMDDFKKKNPIIFHLLEAAGR